MMKPTTRRIQSVAAGSASAFLGIMAAAALPTNPYALVYGIGATVWGVVAGLQWPKVKVAGDIVVRLKTDPDDLALLRQTVTDVAEAVIARELAK